MSKHKAGMPVELVIMVKAACHLGCTKADVARASGYSVGTIGLIAGGLTHREVKVDWDAFFASETGASYGLAYVKYKEVAAGSFRNSEYAKARAKLLDEEEKFLEAIKATARRLEEERERREQEICEPPLRRGV